MSPSKVVVTNIEPADGPRSAEGPPHVGAMTHTASPGSRAPGDGTPPAHDEVIEVIDDELERLLQTDPRQGLTDAEALERLARFGPNAIPEKKANALLKFLSYFGGPISFLLEFAAVVSAVLGDWVDFGILAVVLVINALIGFVEEAKAESALDALKNTLALKCRAWRNGRLVDVPAETLVPGDVIALRLGDIVPADARLLGVGVTGEATQGALHVDQSALTGESLPVKKAKNAVVFSSSIIKQGQMLAVVAKTGLKTYIGRAANLISVTTDEGHFQKIIGRIGNFLIVITVAMVGILLVVEMTAKTMYSPQGTPIMSPGERFKVSLKQVLILAIAAIPVGLPTVLSATMAVGASQLSKKQVIVKRLTAIEELASVSVLCSDKTGTLTLNRLTIDRPFLARRGGGCESGCESGDGAGGANAAQLFGEDDLLLTAFLASEHGTQDPIESAVRSAAITQVAILRDREHGDLTVPGFRINEFIPFNPVSKFTEATVTDAATGLRFRCIKGAPQVVIEMCGGHAEATAVVVDLARRGLRALGVARTATVVDPASACFQLVGLISLLDPPRPDSAHTIRECRGLGISFKMITGDQLIIAKEVAHRLGMPRTILDAHKLMDESMSESGLTDRVIKADGFAQVVPEHKFRVVELMQKRGLLVGMTGDGVNDAPALKKANVGIAVEGCTDAARSAADIVLLAPGLSTIVDGIKTSRAIFQRMRSYALYRIASTIHFLIFFFISLLVFGFSLPDRLIILIAVLNDVATLVIAFDHTLISDRPDKWRLGQLMLLSFILGALLMGISFAHYFVARDAFGVTPAQLQTIMYLQISSCPHFVIFSTRLPTWFWKAAPSPLFVIAVGGTQVFAMFMSVYGVSFFDAVPIGWGWGVSVLAISTACFMLLDIVKVLVIRHWSFGLTAALWPTPTRRAELRKRREELARKVHTQANIDKMRRAVWAAEFIFSVRSKANGPDNAPKRRDAHDFDPSRSGRVRDSSLTDKDQDVAVQVDV
ncbi:hypothetical protein HK105_205872 [Polyrhizophydium stewartii]|uniref:Plasma membrane ATPase n=1 Tax=Polyrhizophydium stewartii TaxID=2732419 RepID=A0ABR4N4U0_9FUNG